MDLRWASVLCATEKVMRRMHGEQWKQAVMDQLQLPQAMQATTMFSSLHQKESDKHGYILFSGPICDCHSPLPPPPPPWKSICSKEKNFDLRDLLLCITRLWDVFRIILKPSIRCPCYHTTRAREEKRTPTHPHTHTERERERERENVWS